MKIVPQCHKRRRGRVFDVLLDCVLTSGVFTQVSAQISNRTL